MAKNVQMTAKSRPYALSLHIFRSIALIPCDITTCYVYHILLPYGYEQYRNAPGKFGMFQKLNKTWFADFSISVIIDSTPHDLHARPCKRLLAGTTAVSKDPKHTLLTAQRWNSPRAAVIPRP